MAADATTNSINDLSDLRAYPSQTAVYFWIIVIVLLGVAVAGAVGPSPLLMWPTALTILILPVRAFLAWPDREIAKRQDSQAAAELTANGILPRLQAVLTNLAAAHNHDKPIKIIIGPAADQMHAVSSWRRHYLFIGQAAAQRLDNDLQTPERRAVVEAALLHEIAHFLHKDVQRVGYTRELLRGSFLIPLWWMFFLLGWLSFTALAGQAFLRLDLNQIPGLDPMTKEVLASFITLSPEARAEIAAKMTDVNIRLVLNYVTNAFAPVIWMSLFLWLFFWRRMLRLQEHYADYFVNSVTQRPDALRRAWFDYEPQPLYVAAIQPKLPLKLRDVWQSVWFQVTEAMPLTASNWYQQLVKKIHAFKQWFAYHPALEQRSTFLLNPMNVYESWHSVAFSTLALVLALEILLTTPLIGYYVSSTYVIHFATLSVFVLLATWALPLLAQGKPLKRPLQKSLILIYGVSLGWIALTFSLLLFLSVVAPNFALEILNSIIFAGGRFAGNPTSLPVNNALVLVLSIIPSYLGLRLLSLTAVMLLLFIYIRLQRRAVQTGMVANWQRRHWKLITALSVTAVTLILTPLSDLLQGNADSLFQPARILSYIAGLGGALWLVIHAKRVS